MFCPPDWELLKWSIMKCHESHIGGIGIILVLNDPTPSLNAISHYRKSASVRQADGPTNFNPFDPDKKSAVLRQKKSASVQQP